MLDGEKKIIEDAIKGEASAFGLLYDKYHPQIYRFIYLKVGQREEAEDLTHQVFLSALQNIGKYQHKGFPFSSWLYQISRNKIIDHWRTRKNTLDIEDAVEQGENDLEIEKIGIKFEIERVRKAISLLKDEYQDVIIMRFIEELSYEEIAAALNKPRTTVRVLQHRAIKQLKDILENESR